MKLFHSHYHTLSKTHSKFVILFLTCIILTGLLLGLLSFNILLNEAAKETQNVQQSLDSTLVWDSVSYNLDSSLTFWNIAIKNPEDSRTLSRIKSFTVKINYSTFFETLFADFDSLPRHRKYDFKKKSLDFLILKSLSLFQINGLTVDVSTQKDRIILKNLFTVFFNKRVLPKNAKFILEETQLRILNAGVDYSAKADLIQGYLHEDNGIIVKYSIEAGMDFLTSEFSSTLNGSFDLFDVKKSLYRIQFETTPISLNKYIVIKPLQINFEQDESSSILHIDGTENRILSLRNMQYTASNKVQSEFLSFQLGEIIELKGENQENFISMLETNVEGAINLELLKDQLRYTLSLNNKEDSNFDIDIDIEKTDNSVHFHSLFLEFQEQVINWKGSINLQTWIPEGFLDLSISEPFALIPISSKVEFYTENTKTYASITNLNIHGFYQSNFTFLYDSINNSIDLFEEGKPEVILSTLLRSDTYKNLDERNIISPENVRILSISFKSLDLSLLDNIFFNNKNINLFSLLSLNGQIDIQFKNRQLYDLSYSIMINENEQDVFYFSSNGKYHVDDGFFIQGLFSVYEKISGTFSSDDSVQKSFFQEKPVLVNVQTQYLGLLPEGENESAQIYTDDFALMLKANVNSFDVSIEDMLNISLGLKESQIEKIHVQLSAFSLTGIEQSIDALLDVELNETSIAQFTSYINVYNTETALFQFTASYQNGKGSMKSDYTYADDKKLQVSGTFEHDPLEELFNFSLEEIDEEDKKQRRTQSSGTYNFLNNTITVSFANVSPQLFAKNLEGSINGTLQAKRDVSFVDLTLEQSEIILTENNTRYTIQGNSLYTADTIQIYKLSIENTDVHYSVQNAKLDGTNLQGALRIASKSNEIIPNVVVDVDIEIEEAFDLFQNNNFKPNFKGNISIEPYYTDLRYIPPNYNFNLGLEYNDGNLKISEKNNKLFFKRSEVGIVEGQLGNKNEAYLIQISGIQKDSDLGFRLDIQHLDLARIIRELYIETNMLLVEEGDLSGTFFVRGTVSKPKFYASLQSSSLSLLVPSIEQSYITDEILINISNNQISIPNVKIRSNNPKVNIRSNNSNLILNIKGFFEKYTIASLQIGIISDSDNYHIIPTIKIGNIVTSGNVRGAVSIEIDTHNIIISGTLYLKGTSIFLQEEVDLVQEFKNDKRIIAIDLKLKTDSSVIFYWPNKSFPVLKSYFEKNQELNVVYDTYSNLTHLNGDIAIQGGTVYYFNKGFRITNGKIFFDTKNYNTPYIEDFEATSSYRIDNQNYVITLSTVKSFFDDIQFKVSSYPSLSEYNIQLILGGASSTTDENTFTDSSESTYEDIGRTIASFSDQLSNISLVSQLEQLLAQSLNLDYLSFRTKIVENLLVNTISEQRNDFNSVNPVSVFSTLVDGSYLEIGKFFQLAYLSLVLQIQEQLRSDINGSNSSLYLSTKVNIDIPTPILDFSWSFQPNLFNYTDQYPRLQNTVSLSWGIQY